MRFNASNGSTTDCDERPEVQAGGPCTSHVGVTFNQARWTGVANKMPEPLLSISIGMPIGVRSNGTTKRHRQAR